MERCQNIEVTGKVGRVRKSLVKCATGDKEDIGFQKDKKYSKLECRMQMKHQCHTNIAINKK